MPKRLPLLWHLGGVFVFFVYEGVEYGFDFGDTFGVVDGIY